MPGFTADLTLENENEYKVTITYDFEAMDVKKAEGMTYFKKQSLTRVVEADTESICGQSHQCWSK